eukprot:CAMPEP_0178396902 /NCGR_PEP_ID=MMETSP0689_2-20121128/13969_1 /TAXON_ID=160604 /ORGANISM="Amphidinium massartii, Strain CS-259" /LENGTH=515 /DNA_ID=CAMNT_0020017593 /DNA_START=13 /DNA_END=1557 /DNA_ORIENTATION=+
MRYLSGDDLFVSSHASRLFAKAFTSFGGDEVIINDDDPPGTEASDPAYPRPVDPDDEECDWDGMKVGNNIDHWTGIQGDIRRTYDTQLKGVEIRQWWPGATGNAECDDSTAPRGCWFRARVLNDPFCTESKRCLHIAAHDGEPSHSYTCPQWVKDPLGKRCKLPADKEWQACPMKYNTLRIAGVSGSLPTDRAPSSAEQFKAAINTECSDLKLTESGLGDESHLDPHKESPTEHHVDDGRDTSFQSKEPTVGTDDSTELENDDFGDFSDEKDDDVTEDHDDLTERGLHDDEHTNHEASVREAIERMKPAPECQEKCKVECSVHSPTPVEHTDDETPPRTETGDLDDTETPTVPPTKKSTKTKKDTEPDTGHDNPVKSEQMSQKQEQCMEKCLHECMANFHKDHCIGPTIEDSPDNNYFFDVKNNSWYWCTPDLRCARYDIKQIFYPMDGKCGKTKVCEKEEGCFEHEVTSKKSVFHCVPKSKTFVIGAGDDEGVQAAIPLPVAFVAALGCPKSFP